MLGADAEFVGSAKCKKCHLAEHKSWVGLKHAKALEILRPGNSKEAKEKAKPDPAKDYTKGAACVACHTVGFLKAGGTVLQRQGKCSSFTRFFVLARNLLL